LLGYPDRALASIRDAVRLAERLGHPLSLDIAYLYEAVIHLFRHKPDMALQRAHAAEVLAAEQRLALNLEPNILRGGALLAQGAIDRAVASMREGIAAAAVWQLYRPYHLALYAEALGRVGDYDGALTTLADALDGIERNGERWWEAEIHRLKRRVFTFPRKVC